VRVCAGWVGGCELVAAALVVFHRLKRETNTRHSTLDTPPHTNTPTGGRIVEGALEQARVDPRQLQDARRAGRRRRGNQQLPDGWQDARLLALFDASLMRDDGVRGWREKKAASGSVKLLCACGHSVCRPSALQSYRATLTCR
jgi:hypothetical protein